MTELYNKIIDKKEFCKVLGSKIGLEGETIRNYLTIGKVPEKHQEKVLKALKLRLELDEKIKSLTVCSYI